MKNLNSAVVCLALASAVGACKEEEPAPGPPTEFEPQPEQPLVLNNDLRAVTIFPTSSLQPLAATIVDDQALARQLVFSEQIFSEFADSGGAASADPEFSERVEAWYNNPAYDGVRAAAGTVTWVVDLQRLDREWLVDWEGGVRDEPDNRGAMTFQYRQENEESDYQNDVEADLLKAMESVGAPDRIVIGVEMDRYFVQARADWPYFVSFARELAASLRTAHPGLKVGVGLNWSHFMDTIVPTYVGVAEQETVNYAVVRAAWKDVIDPLYVDIDADTQTATPVLDFYAFSSIPDSTTRYLTGPDQLADNHYLGIYSRFHESPDRVLPVSWFAIGWPTIGSSSYTGDFVERFLELNGGYLTDLVSWWGYVNFEGSGECVRVMETSGVTSQFCTRGFYTTSAFPASANLNTAYFGE